MQQTLSERLLMPHERETVPARLGDVWFHQIIRFRVARPAQHDPLMACLNRVRGAWGNRLADAASPAALAGAPCTFNPPCALDVFMREQGRLDARTGVPKPYVFAIEPHRAHLDVRLTVFGFACEWALPAREALGAALARDTIWRAGTTGTTLEAQDIITVQALPVPPAPDAVLMRFQTPVDMPSADALQSASSLITRSATRVAAMARWMDLGIEPDICGIEAACDALGFGIMSLDVSTARRGSRRQDAWYENNVALGEFILEGDLAPVWPWLYLGQTTHTGRGATAGYGCYTLEGLG